MSLLQAINLGKRYQITYEKGALVRYLLPKFLRMQKFGDFWALRNISFSLEAGEVLGVIGPNGSGKTTLLNLCSGITDPTEGQVIVHGKVASLLTLGAGFHPDLSGEENIYLNGAILGLSVREIRKKMDAIIQFSGLGHLIEAPLQTYSAGMMMRLGFSIAIQASLDLLVIDEILTVGDTAFQKKCFAKLEEFRKMGKAIILATHGLETVESFCDCALLLETGRNIADGDPREIVEVYRRRMNGNGEHDTGLSPQEKKKILLALRGGGNQKSHLRPNEFEWTHGAWRQRFGMGKAEIKNIQILNKEGQEVETIKAGDFLKIRVEYQVTEPIADPHFGIAIYRDDGVYCFGPNTRFDGIKTRLLEPGDGWFELSYPSIPLLGGRYSLTVAIWEKEEQKGYDYHHAMFPFKIKSSRPDYGVVFLPHQWLLAGDELASQGNLMMGFGAFQREMEEKIGRWLKGIQTTSMQGGVELKMLEVTPYPPHQRVLTTGETLLISGIFQSEKPIDQVALWVGLFREDGILCYGTSSLADGILFDLNPGKTEWGIQFPKIPLLRGKFRIGIAWGDLRQQVWGIAPEAGWLEMKETLSHHGLVAIPRKWRGSAFGWRSFVGKH